MAFLFGSTTKQTQSEQPTKAAGITVQTSCYGKVIPVVYGTTKIGPNLIWCGAFNAVAHTSSSGGGSSGGKGGGGGGSTSTTSYTYTESVAFALCEGPIEGVGAVWVSNNTTATTAAALGYAVFPGGYDQGGWAYLDGFTAISEKHVIPSAAPYRVSVDYTGAPFTDGGVKDGSGETFAAVSTTPSAGQYAVADGTYTFASADAGRDVTISYTASDQEPPNEALSYRGIAYIAAANYDLGTSSELPNHNVEVQGIFSASVSGADDADPSLVVADILANPHYGLAPAFPSDLVGDLSRYSSYCLAAGLLISPAYTEAQTAATAIGDIATYTNADVAWTGGKFTLIPRGGEALSGNGASYEAPDFVFALGDDDWLPANAASTSSGSSSGDPLILSTRRPQDAVNQVTLEFVNRANSYYNETVVARDLAAIQTYGLNADSTRTAHLFADAASARASAQLILQRAQNLNSWAGTVGEHCIALDIGDVGTISNAAQSLSDWPVRITEISEQSDGSLLIAFEDFVLESGTAGTAAVAQGRAAVSDYNADPGPINTPVLFEPPDPITTSGLELWAAVSGGPLWGGAEVWISLDGETYTRAGALTAPARQGVLSTALPAGGETDTENALAVDLSECRGALISVSEIDAALASTLSYVDGELVAYQVATLTGSYAYDLTALGRGLHGTTISAHPKGAAFARLDSAIFKYPFTAAYIGRTVLIKFVSYNLWEGGLQDISEVDPYSYTLRGTALASPLPDVSGLTTAYVAGITNLTWKPVTDFREVDYEIRQGPSFTTAQVIGRTTLTSAPAFGDGTYWVAAHYQIQNGADVYSENWASVEIAGAQLVANVLAGYDEAETSWGGTLSGAAIVGGALRNLGAGDISLAPDFAAIDDVANYGGVAASASYAVPVSHRIDAGRVCAASVLMTVAARGVSVFDDISRVADFAAIVDVAGANLGPVISAVPQIRVSQDGSSWSDWSDWIPGAYQARAFDFRVLLATGDSQVIPELTGFSFLVDVPDRVDGFTALAVPATGFAITYDSPFNGGPNGAAIPNVQITIVNALPGDDAILSSQTLSGLSGQIVNNGTGVARTLNIIAQGY